MKSSFRYRLVFDDVYALSDLTVVRRSHRLRPKLSFSNSSRFSSCGLSRPQILSLCALRKNDKLFLYYILTRQITASILETVAIVAWIFVVLILLTGELE